MSLIQKTRILQEVQQRPLGGGGSTVWEPLIYSEAEKGNCKSVILRSILSKMDEQRIWNYGQQPQNSNFRRGI
jgi:hypothetical protein